MAAVSLSNTDTDIGTGTTTTIAYFSPGVRNLTLMDLPTEIHLKILEQCALDRPRIPESNDSRGRHRRLLGGSLRDVTLVSQYFRSLTIPYLFESICINDASEATMEDKLIHTCGQFYNCGTANRLQHMKKFTVSLGRTPNPHRAYAAQGFIETLNYLHGASTMRYVLETKSVTYTLLNDIRQKLLKWRRQGTEFLIFDVRQLELACPWGSHRWDYQFLTWPYLNTERLWLDFNTDDLRCSSLSLEKMRNLEYVMHRAHPVTFLSSHLELEAFNGLTAKDGPRPPKLRQLGHTMRQVKHLALCGLLKGPVTEIAPLLRDMQSLKQLDITDQQAITEDDILAINELYHPLCDIDWAMKHTELISTHPNNVDRIEAATVFFTTLPKLQRICFVRDQIGTFYHAIRDTNNEKAGTVGPVSSSSPLPPFRVEVGDEVRENWRYLRNNVNDERTNHSAIWRCGFPNRLGYQLWDRCGRGSGSTVLRADHAFWMNEAFRAGDHSMVPYHLRYDVCEKKVFGTRPGSIDSSSGIGSGSVSGSGTGTGTGTGTVTDGIMISPDVEEGMTRLGAKNAERRRFEEEKARRDSFIRGQGVKPAKED